MAESIPLHGDDGDQADEPKPRARRGRPPKRAGEERTRRPSLETRMRESLEAVADWLRDRGDSELGDLLQRDAPKMAAVLGRLAKLNPLASKAVAVVADLLEPVRAFGPTLRVLWRRLLERRERIAEETETETLETSALVHTPEQRRHEEPGPTIAEPWRIAEES